MSKLAGGETTGILSVRIHPGGDPCKSFSLKFRHPERSECEAFAQSKDPVAFTPDNQWRTKPPSRVAASPRCPGRARDLDA
jgi:hypothetical protein